MTSADKLKKLKQQREKIDKQIRLEKARLAAQERKDATRRKILDGALIQSEAKSNPTIAKLLEKLRREKLTKPHDRALFGLEPLKETPETQAKPKPANAE